MRVHFVKGAAAKQISPHSRGKGGIDIETETSSWTFDHVFSTVDNKALASMLPRGRTADAIAGVVDEYASVCIVTMAFDDTAAPFPGFGHLCPQTSDLGVLGVIYDSENFPVQGDIGQLRLSVMMGGTRMPWVLDRTDDEVASLAIRAIWEHLGIADNPGRIRVLRHRNCIPQYPVGHRAQVQRAEKHCALDFGGDLTFIGTSFYGVGIPDSVAYAHDAAEAFIASST